MIHIAYGIYGGTGHYAKFLGTSMTSIFENVNSTPPPPWITIHILHANTLSEDDRDKLVYLAGCYGQQIKFYNVEKLLPEKIDYLQKSFKLVNKSRFTIGTLFRLLIPEVVDKEIEKVICLDADTVANLDINELWRIDLGDNVLAAMSEGEKDYIHEGWFENKYLLTEKIVEPQDYFNAGVLMINLNRLRQEEENLKAGIDFVASHPQCRWFDQDIWNYCFSKKYKKIHEKFNFNPYEERMNNVTVLSKKIYHYMAMSLNLDTGDIFNRLWFKYFCKTPWFNEDVFGNLFEGVRNIFNEGKSLALQTARILSGKERGFFVEGANLDAVKNIFAVEDGEEIISDASIEDLIQSMKKSQGRKVYFIFAVYFPAVHQALTAQGFEFGKDFLNGIDYLSEAQGMFFDTNFLVNML